MSALDLIINISTAPNNTIKPVSIIKKLIFLTKAKPGIDDEYITITSKEKLATYLNNNDVALTLLDYGLKEVTLAFSDKLKDFTILNTLGLTILVDDDSLDLKKLDSFKGAKVFYKNQMNVANTKLAQAERTCVILSKDCGLPIKLFSSFLSRNEFKNHQLKQFPNEELLILNEGDAVKAFDEGYTYLYGDDTTVQIPSLYNFKLGGDTVTNFYIKAQLEFEIQVTSYNWIAKNEPKYDNNDIFNLEVVGRNIIDKYKQLGLIIDGSYSILTKDMQAKDDIIKGIVNGLDLGTTPLNSIWRIIGTAREIF